MERKIGKITGATLAALLIILMAANLIVPLVRPIVATPINPRAVPTLGNAELQGDIWYVDGNMLADTGTGKSWADAKKYLSSAMALSNADIARDADRQWAARNTIYVRGDTITEDMVILAQKTDIIGVGSYDSGSRPGITGSWIIPDTVDYMGCHFYNMYFADTGATALFDIDTQTGLEFHNCRFEGGSGSLTTIGLQVEESSFLVVEGCEFSVVSATAPFTASAIQIVNDTNPIYGCKIQDNIIMSAGIGIDWDETESYNCWITDNYIKATGMTIDEEGDNVFVINNRLITEVDTGTSTAGYDFNIEYALGNLQTGSTNDYDSIPYIAQTE